TISPFAVMRVPASCLRRWNTGGARRRAKTSSRSCTAVATLLTFCPPGPEAAMKLSSAMASARATRSSIGKSERGEVGREGRGGRHGRLAGAGNVQTHRVEHRARSLAVTIDRIAEQRHADTARGVDTDLVRAAG